MNQILQEITLAARTLQGIIPIFIEYALWISIMGLFIFVLGELMAHIFSYKDKRVEWVASAFGVHDTEVIPIPSAYLMARETKHPTTSLSNPYNIKIKSPTPHQADYLVLGQSGTMFVSIYNWRFTKVRSAKNMPTPGQVQSFETVKDRYFTGFKKETITFSPDDDAKSKASTLNAALVSKFGSSVRVSTMCLHKNRPPALVTRSPHRDINGRLAAHIDIEQINNTHLPCGSSGRIDEETWHDLRKWFIKQPARMMNPVRTSGRIIIMFVLLIVFSQTESTTISAFEIEILQTSIQELLTGASHIGSDKISHSGPQ